jgi:hypothetical protein
MKRHCGQQLDDKGPLLLSVVACGLRVLSGLEGPQPKVHPLPLSVEELLVLSVRNPTMAPQQLTTYIIHKIMSAPVPSPKAAVAWLQFVCWQVPQVRQRPSRMHGEVHS